MELFRMNIIKQYEIKYISLENLLEKIWGHGQQLINENKNRLFQILRINNSWRVLNFWISYIEL